MLTQEQKRQVDGLLDTLLDTPADDRWPRLAQWTSLDPAVRAEVESLLRASESVGDFLTHKARTGLPEDDPQDDLGIGTRLDGWIITGRIGRGGMGEVYKAERAHGDFEQRVAIKVLQREARAELERFRVERQILARLEHPAIARLLDGGATPTAAPTWSWSSSRASRSPRYCAATHATLEQRLNMFVRRSARPSPMRTAT